MSNSATISAKKPRAPGVSSPLEKAMFGIGDIGAAMCFSFMSSFITLYYTDSAGLSAAFVGTMMLVVRIFDGISDIGMGILLEKTNTRFGKVRPWFAVSAILMAVGGFLAFRVPESLGMSGKEVYATITYGFTAIIAYTIHSVAFNAFLPRFSLDPHDQNKASVVQKLIATVGLLVIFSLTPTLLAGMGGERSQGAWSSLTTIFSIGCLVLVLCMFLFMKEKIKPSIEKKADKIPLKVSFKAVMKNRYFPLLIIIFICTFASSGLMSGATTYYCRDVLGDLGVYTIITIAMIVPAVVGYPFVPLIFKKFGKRRAMVVGGIASTVCILVSLINPYNTGLFIAMTVLATLMNVPFNAAIITMVADLVDYGAYKSGGVRSEGFASMASSIGTKIGMGIGAAMTGWFLALGGYNPGLAVQPQSAVTSMIVLVIGVRAVLTVVSAIALFFWDIEKYRPKFKQAQQGTAVEQQS